MRAYKSEINTNQIGDESKYKALSALTALLNDARIKKPKLTTRTIRLIHEYNEWIKQIEKGIIRVNLGIFGREVKWYQYRCSGRIGESYLINYIKARSRNVPKTLFIPSYRMLNNKKRREGV